MPLILPLAIAAIAVLLGIALMPIGLVQRYRAGTARRPVRRWVTNLNIAALSFSTVLFLGGAAISTLWLPGALTYSSFGFGGGCLLGLLGLRLTRWERGPDRLHYTPNRMLVLLITLVVTARLIYGLWRLWQTWQTGMEGRPWLAESGVSGSLAIGALVLGYTLTYWIGLRRQSVRFRS